MSNVNDMSDEIFVGNDDKLTVSSNDKTKVKYFRADGDTFLKILGALKYSKTIIGHPDDQFSMYLADLIERLSNNIKTVSKVGHNWVPVESANIDEIRVPYVGGFAPCGDFVHSHRFDWFYKFPYTHVREGYIPTPPKPE